MYKFLRKTNHLDSTIRLPTHLQNSQIIVAKNTNFVGSLLYLFYYIKTIMQVQVLMFKQDDPKKCTAAKLVKFGIAKNIRSTLSNTLILDPFADRVILKNDRLVANSVTGIDCSWEFAQETFVKAFSGIHRKL